ncbi:Uncharacterized protein CLAVI_000772 [Candidatus Clavichlamydia salmonicola]|uniref:CT253 family lipoprotein n=1 Tax=Candidatus Clavichlamydia salmonicola TaxID=469812 RepID=UPI001891181B|nr:CT253 family lipoprotein [Candidatus Clavichlamydia salmonicola]MBF5051136.1 Uncharacterized protein [Candidatus Clavichlamydia salmonicola]
MKISKKQFFAFCLFIFSSGIISGGCVSKTGALYQGNGRAKAMVSVLPVMAGFGMEVGLPWSVSEEFFTGIKKRLRSSQKVYLMNQAEYGEWSSVFSNPDPTAISSSISQIFAPSEFVVSMELIPAKEVALRRVSDVAPGFGLAVRVRIFDVRNDMVKLVFQEIVECAQSMLQPSIPCDYQKHKWGTGSFDSTPIGLFHGRLIRDLVHRIEGYVSANH